MDDLPQSKSPPATVAADDDNLAQARVRFLTSAAVETDQVRQPILSSWRRSRDLRVPADHIALPYVDDRDLEVPLVRGAAPVLARLGDQLAGQPISLIVTDPSGVVLSQRTGDPDLHRHLEGVELLPGFNYGERFVGTNGIGTALYEGRPAHVFGHEHYAEHLEDLACAAVPIQHPISGKTIGAVDLTCWRRDAGGLLIALARTAAEQIRQSLLLHSNIRELILFQAYLQACRRSTGIVMAVNDNLVMMNDAARQLLDPADQTVLLAHAAEALATGPRATATVALTTGSRVRMHCRTISGDNETSTAGTVLSAKLLENDDERVQAAPILPLFLPGVVGSSAPWLRCCHEVDDAYARRDWLVLAGEPGTGKHAVAQGVHRRHNPAGRVHTLDAALAGPSWDRELVEELLTDPVEALIVRHADQLGVSEAHTLADVLREARSPSGAKPPWVVLTLGSDTETGSELAALLSLFPRTVTVPPLRAHAEDLSELVPLFLSKLGHGGQLTCAPTAMHLLMRAAWPGNVTQLYEVLKRVGQQRRTGAVHPYDLPPEFHTVARKQLNRLEETERDAIVRGLEDADGNKARAARLLGVSRATIYRKIHEYGIVTPDH
ncbi:sigma-54-dependent Fis family transcriptional regulator [Amycolatopsis panacis]|uniref:sigma-54-dependent Fis family transcriptional regulator n=1 Tax=Amycolatopsis panacis TaxID=2340917 RepID=UPI001F439779|nr:helix-turn-helix domain-containing protein [Amycolatopsis panacis]